MNSAHDQGGFVQSESGTMREDLVEGKGGEGVAVSQGGGVGCSGGNGNSFGLKAPCPVCLGDGSLGGMTDALWDALRLECCSTGLKAHRIIMLHKQDIAAALKRVRLEKPDDAEIKLNAARDELRDARAEYLKVIPNPIS